MHRDAEALPFRRRQRIEMGGRHGLGQAVALDEIEIEAGVCTENLSSGVVVVKSAKDGV
jgi:hypothetical protein